MTAWTGDFLGCSDIQASCVCLCVCRVPHAARRAKRRDLILPMSVMRLSAYSNPQ